MNREEAIHRIQDIERCTPIHTREDVRDFEALEMAIKALEQEPCGDAIDRAKAIMIASGYCHPANVAKELAKMPPVTPQPKTGHWIMPVQDDGMSDPIYYQVRCSKCGFDLDPQTWHMELHQYGADKYCPSCGAKMSES